MDIVTTLEDLHNARCAMDALRLQRDDVRARVIPPEVQAALDAIEAEWAPAFEQVQAQIAELEQAVKDAVIRAGASVKSEHLHAVYAQGRVSWNTKALDGYAAAHPELATFRSVGAPSVSIRTV